MKFNHWYSGDPTPVAYTLKDGLEAALYERGHTIKVPKSFTEIEGFYSDNIKANKLAHRAIDVWNLPMVRSWYKYGQIVPYGEITPQELSPEPLRSPNVSNRPPSRSGAGELPSKATLRNWFLDLTNPNLDEIMEMELFEFLEWDYETFADDYKDLYLTNLDLLKLFENIGMDDNLYKNAEQYRSELQGLTLDLKYEMSRKDIFNDEVRWFVESALRTIQDGLIKLSNETSPSSEQEKAVRDSYYNYHSNVWHWPALYISIERVDGPENYVKEFVARRENDASETGGTSPKWLNSYQEELLDLNLLPGCQDYESVHGSTPASLQAIESLTNPLSND